MRIRNIYKSLTLLALGITIVSCGHHEGDGHNHSADSPEKEKIQAEENEDGHSDEGLIILNHEQLEQLGIKAEEVSPGSFSEVIKVSGEITARPGAEGIVAARQGGIVKLASGIAEGVSVNAGRTVATVTARGMAGGDPNEAARIAYAAAKREVDRMTPLHNEGIITTRDYNAALQQMEQARAALGAASSGSGSAATAPVSGVISSLNVVDGQYVEAGQSIATISSNRALALRADLPENSARILAGISGARFRPSYSDEVIDITAEGGSLMAQPTAASARGGYIPVYFTIPDKAGSLIGGSYCEVYLMGNTREGVISVPEGAVSEQQGEYFVYTEHLPGHYEKHPVKIGMTDGRRREILSGLSAGDKVVTEGMTFVRLAETSGVVPEGHSHSH